MLTPPSQGGHPGSDWLTPKSLRFGLEDTTAHKHVAWPEEGKNDTATPETVTVRKQLASGFPRTL